MTLVLTPGSSTEIFAGRRFLGETSQGLEAFLGARNLFKLLRAEMWLAELNEFNAAGSVQSVWTVQRPCSGTRVFHTR